MKRIIGVLFALALVLAWVYVPMDKLPEFLDWIRGKGIVGAFAIAVFYAVAVVLMIPGSLITLGIGAVYGPWLGLAIVSPASVLGATIAFLLGRGLAKDSIDRKMGKNSKFVALSRAIELNGFKVLALVRLSPLFPYTVVNYAFGLTGLRLYTYIIGSFLGMLPGTLMYVYLGSTIGDVAGISATAQLDSSPLVTGFKIIGLLATILVTWIITRTARKALMDEMSENSAN